MFLSEEIVLSVSNKFGAGVKTVMNLIPPILIGSAGRKIYAPRVQEQELLPG